MVIPKFIDELRIIILEMYFFYMKSQIIKYITIFQEFS